MTFAHTITELSVASSPTKTEWQSPKGYRHQIAVRRLKLLKEAMGGRCVLCGYDGFFCSLDIHHVDPNGKDREHRLGYKSLKDGIAEVKKCVLLCRNCHSAHHYGGLELPLAVVEGVWARTHPIIDGLAKKRD